MATGPAFPAASFCLSAALIAWVEGMILDQFAE